MLNAAGIGVFVPGRVEVGVTVDTAVDSESVDVTADVGRDPCVNGVVDSAVGDLEVDWLMLNLRCGSNIIKNIRAVLWNYFIFNGQLI